MPRSGLEAVYSSFKFAYTTKVLLECPVYNENTAYVVNSGEERWLTTISQQNSLNRKSQEDSPIGEELVRESKTRE